MVSCCADNSVVPYDDDRCDAVVLGLESAGKTLIVRRLQSLNDRARQKSFHASTWPTTGVEIAIIRTGGGGACKLARTRELGGCMSPIWPNYYEDADSLMYVIDMSAPATWTAAAEQLKGIMAHEHMQGKPCLVVLNKCDVAPFKPSSMMEMETTLDWPAMHEMCKGGLDMLAVSALTGSNLDSLLKWLVRTKLQAQHKAISAS